VPATPFLLPPPYFDLVYLMPLEIHLNGQKVKTFGEGQEECTDLFHHAKGYSSNLLCGRK
jgi:hypothetical protein